MRIFLTGATGFVGSLILTELQSAGHQVLGLTRSESGARKLAAAGAEVHYGTIEDLDSLRAAADRVDAVIHTAFDHDFTTYAANCEKDRAAILAMGSVLHGSPRPLIITSATGMGDVGEGRPAVEHVFNADYPIPRVASELAGHVLLQSGVDVRVVRLPQVHDTVKQGLITPYVEHARKAGSVGYLGEGNDCWSAAHVTDVARLYVRVLEAGRMGARYHAVAEERVMFRHIAEAVAAGLGLPPVSLSTAEAEAHFGWLSIFIGLDKSASSDWTREQLGWEPIGPTLLSDLRAMNYTSSEQGKA